MEHTESMLQIRQVIEALEQKVSGARKGPMTNLSMVDGGALIGGNKVMTDAAYNGMEIQVLDDTGDKKQHLKAWQYHGSIYGVVAAQKGALRPVGEWNDEEVTVDGENVTVVLNGKTILATSVKDLPTDGTTPDGKPHPGLHNPSGYVGFLGHTMPVRFRNIRVKEL